MPRPTRRVVLAAGAVALLAACAPRSATSAPSPSATRTPVPSPSATTPAPPPVLDVAAALADVEQRHGVRLGVHALDTTTGATASHRADERFAFCSTFKPLAAGAVLAARGAAGMDEGVPVEAVDLVTYSPVTELRVGTTMTWRELADAALRFSDNTAGNLLLEGAGGPAGLTAWLRGVGDDVTRSDRTEPDLNDHRPGDERDTSTPRALAGTYASLVLGDVLGVAERDLLTDWMLRSTTGDALVRAGAQPGWEVADKSGAGAYATRNDVAVVWTGARGTDAGAPVVLAVLSDQASPDAVRTDAPVAEAARVVLDALVGVRATA